MNIHAIAWQLRSGNLALDGDRVTLRESAIITADPKTRESIQARADAINAILTESGRHFETIEAVQDYFNELENTA